MLKHLNQLVKFKTGMDVRIGFPGEQLAAETTEEINQPMYSTSIGLLLKGLEYYKENGEEMVLNKAEEELAPETEQQEEIDADEEKSSKKVLKKGKIFENLKNTLHDIFDESDVKM